MPERTYQISLGLIDGPSRPHIDAVAVALNIRAEPVRKHGGGEVVSFSGDPDDITRLSNYARARGGVDETREIPNPPPPPPKSYPHPSSGNLSSWMLPSGSFLAARDEGGYASVSIEIRSAHTGAAISCPPGSWVSWGDGGPPKVVPEPDGFGKGPIGQLGIKPTGEIGRPAYPVNPFFAAHPTTRSGAWPAECYSDPDFLREAGLISADTAASMRPSGKLSLEYTP